MAAPVTFTPMKGALSLGRLLAHRLGLGGLWEGEDGFEGVIRQKLGELGVPKKPLPLMGPEGLTPRQMAEQAGFIKRARPHRRGLK